MAKSTLIIEDTIGEDGLPSVSLTGDISGSEEGVVTNSTLMSLAVHKLFETHWLAKNITKIIPEIFFPIADKNTEETKEGNTPE